MTTPDQLRIGDAERDAATSVLHEHFVQGRLTRDELDERLAATMSAKTAGELRQVTRDLPELPGAGRSEPPVHRPTPSRRGRHPGPPRFVFALFPLFVIGAIIAGTGWAFFGVLKVIFFVWLAMTVFGLLRHHRRRSYWAGGRGRRW